MAFPIRGLDPEVIERLDAAAEARGMSRNAYLVDLLTRHAQDIRPRIDRRSFAQAADLAADLGDDELMRSAWS